MDFKLILKKLNNTLTKEESKIFDAWHRASKNHRNYFRNVQENYSKGLDFVDVEKGWAVVSSRTTKKKHLYSFFKYAAVIVILLTTASLWFLDNENKQVQFIEETNVVRENKIEIGSDKATLTLEDGSNITLEKGQSYETNEVSSNGEQLVYNGKEGQSEKVTKTNILTIPRGGQFFVILADGTKVWMNSETQLKYPVAFTDGETREVELVYGEAYFEVSPSTFHNGSHFIVQTQHQKIEVLGTQFNVRAYGDDDQIATTLVEGKVVVDNGKDSKDLSPGQQSTSNRSTQKLDVATVNVYNEISWKDGLFSFKNRSLEDIMKVLSRWYDVDVVFDNEELRRLSFNGVLRKNLELEEILNIVKHTNEVDYEINEKTIIMK
jgi:ferric-dicitrate binding protein FerR (iron transport regulator)